MWYLSEEYGDFIHIWHIYQVLCIAHSCKIALCSVPNVSNYGHSFIGFVYLFAISEKNGLIVFIFGTLIRYHVLLTQIKYDVALFQIGVIMLIFVFNVMFVVIS